MTETIYASIKTLKSIHSPPPIELKIKGKRYGYLDDSTDYHAMERELTQIKKQGTHYAIIVTFPIKTKENAIEIKYAIYVATRGR
jgi:hypothetical protein